MLKKIQYFILPLMITGNLFAFQLEYTSLIAWDEIWLGYFNQTTDGGFVYIYNSNPIYITKVNAGREPVWTCQYNLPPRCPRDKGCIFQIDNDRYAFIGNTLIEPNNPNETDVEAFIFLFNDNGDSLDFLLFEEEGWCKLIDAVHIENGFALLIEKRLDNDHDEEEYYLVKVDYNLNIIWESFFQRHVAGVRFRSLIQTSNGNYLVGGDHVIHRPDRVFTYGVVKFDSLGNVIDIWDYRTFCIDREVQPEISAMLEIAPNRYACAGRVCSRYLVYLLIDDNGEELVNNVIIDTPVFNENIQAESIPGFGVFLLIDSMTPNCVFLLQVNSNGDSLDGYFFDTDSITRDPRKKMVKSNDNNILISGIRYSRNHGDHHSTMLMKLRPEIENAIEKENDHIPIDQFALLNPVYPNPFNAITKITYLLPSCMDVSAAIFDRNGRKIIDLTNGIQEAGKHRVDWNAKNMPSGIYFIRLSTPYFSETNRLILQK